MSKIHLVMQGKGGVGKSLLAFYIAQYVREKNGKCLVFDTDPLNQTLARTAALEAKVVRILADDHITIMKNAFDLMIEECEKEEADVVIDVGASSFVPMLEYCAVNGVYDLWHEMGHTCILHSIITGKDFLDTCKMFAVVMEKTGRRPSVASIVWLNPFAGPVEKDGRGFNQTAVYRSHVSVNRDVSDAGVHAALRIAMAKFNGQPLIVNGTEEFKERCVAVAIREGLSVTFSDAHMEKERLRLLRPASDQHVATRNNDQNVGLIETPAQERTAHKKEQNRGMSR